MKKITILGTGIGIGVCLMALVCVALPVVLFMGTAANQPEPPPPITISVASTPSELEFRGEIDYRASDRSTHKKYVGPFHTPKNITIREDVYKGSFCLHGSEVGTLFIRVYDSGTLVHEGSHSDRPGCVEFDLR